MAYFYKMENASHILNNKFGKSLNITQLPMLLTLKLLTLIFLHFIGNREKAKVLKYVLRFTPEYVIYSFDQSNGLATFPDVLAQILLRYNA